MIHYCHVANAEHESDLVEPADDDDEPVICMRKKVNSGRHLK